jgi:hypothetical protein
MPEVSHKLVAGTFDGLSPELETPVALNNWQNVLN